MTDIIGELIVPSGIMKILIAISFVFALFSNMRRIALWSLLGATSIFVIFGSGLVAHALMGPLERWYEPVTDPSSLGQVSVIVMLTGYASSNQLVSPPNWVNMSSAYRVLEVMWLKGQFANAPVIISGSIASAEALRDLFLSIGLQPEEVFVDLDAVDTLASASNLQSSIDVEGSCLLVTSAGHMPRAMIAFEHRGLSCHPVPTEYYTTFKPGFFEYLPSPEMLILSDHAFHEYIGISWYWLRNWL